MCSETTKAPAMLPGYLSALVEESRRNLRRIERAETAKAVRFHRENGTYRTVRRV